MGSDVNPGSMDLQGCKLPHRDGQNMGFSSSFIDYLGKHIHVLPESFLNLQLPSRKAIRFEGKVMLAPVEPQTGHASRVQAVSYVRKYTSQHLTYLVDCIPRVLFASLGNPWMSLYTPTVSHAELLTYLGLRYLTEYGLRAKVLLNLALNFRGFNGSIGFQCSPKVGR